MPLPQLREELAIYPGPRAHDGQPSWTLQDPVRSQFFRIDWLTFEILSRWDLGDPAQIAASVSAETPLKTEPGDIEAVVKFFEDNQLLRPGENYTAAGFAMRQKALQGTWAKRLLHNYLYFRVPLVKPDRWLGRWSDTVSPLYSKGFARLSLLVLAIGIIQVYREWDRFAATLVDSFSIAGMVGYGIALVCLKTLHELGHAFTAKRFGCNVPTMGVAFLVLWPLAFTDTNEVWKLADRRQRMFVAASGVAVELMVAAWATFLWAILPEGFPKSVAFTLATTSWIATVMVNASPFLRFDGYFLLCDWLDIPNLHARSFALAKWQLRELLFRLNEEAPEHFSKRLSVGLIAFAYATWVYRAVVFLGIAVLVYTLFAKALGIFLFAVEIWWFILLPVWRELVAWRARWAGIKASPRARSSAIWGLAVLACFVIPWPTRLASSGLLRTVDAYAIYAPSGAYVAELPWQEGQLIPAGVVLVVLVSRDAELRLKQASVRLEQARWQAAVAGVDPHQRQNVQIHEHMQMLAEAEVANLRAEYEKLTPKAPFVGVLRDLDPGVKVGSWVGDRERIATLVREGAWSVETYLDEDAVQRVSIGDGAVFYSDGREGPYVSLTVTGIDRDASRGLNHGMLASQFGGTVLTREKAGVLVPERAVFRVTLAAEDPGRLSGHSWRGDVVIRGAWEAPGMSFLRSMSALVRRESGF
jgi:putative peptide zinc metalloprotease protein